MYFFLSVQVFDAYFAWKSNISKLKESLIDECCDLSKDNSFIQHVIKRCQDKSNQITLSEIQQLKSKLILWKQLKDKPGCEKITEYLQIPENIIGPGVYHDLCKNILDIQIEDFYCFAKGYWIFCQDSNTIKQVLANKDK